MLGTGYKFVGYAAIGLAVAIIVKNFVPYGDIFCIIAAIIFALTIYFDKSQDQITRKVVLGILVAVSALGALL